MNKNSVLLFSEFKQEKLSEENDCWSEEINKKTELWCDGKKRKTENGKS